MAVLHQLLDHAVDQLYLGELALIEEQAGGALGQEGVHAQGQGRRTGEDGSSPGGHPAAPGALAVPAVEIPLRHAHQQVQNQGRRHEYAGAAQDGLHVLLADAGGDDAAQASAAHKGGKDRGADGVDCGNADAGEDDGGGDGDLHMDEAVGTGHAHAPARLDQVLRHLVQPQAGVADDGQQGVEGQTHDDSGLARTDEHHDDAQQCQGGGGLDQIHHSEDDLPGSRIKVAEDAKGNTRQDGEDEGGDHQRQVL